MSYIRFSEKSDHLIKVNNAIVIIEDTKISEIDGKMELKCIIKVRSS